MDSPSNWIRTICVASRKISWVFAEKSGVLFRIPKKEKVERSYNSFRLNSKHKKIVSPSSACWSHGPVTRSFGHPRSWLGIFRWGVLPKENHLRLLHRSESRWRNSPKGGLVGGHGKPIHGSCAIYFPVGIKPWETTGKLTWQWKNTIFFKEMHLQMVGFPIAMLVFWGVNSGRNYWDSKLFRFLKHQYG